jgi:hypothetical protein
MKNGAHVLANLTVGDQTARMVTSQCVQAEGADVVGQLTIQGRDILGNKIEETINVGSWTTRMFHRVTSVVQSGWSAAGAPDTLNVGFERCIGMPALIKDVGDYVQIWLDSTTVYENFNRHVGDEVSKCYIDFGGGDLNNKKLTVLYKL